MDESLRGGCYTFPLNSTGTKLSLPLAHSYHDRRPWLERALVFGLMRLRRFSQNGYYELALGIIAKSVSLPDEMADFKSWCGMGGLAPPRRRTGLRNTRSFGHVSSRPLPHV
jgi:hypothetical protein